MLAIGLIEMYLCYDTTGNMMKTGSTILIVDDEHLYRTIIKKILEDHGFTVAVAGDGAEGLEIMRTKKIDLAIVDLEMPVMDGMEFTKWVKEINPKFPVIIVTAHAKEYSPEELLAANVEALMQKPIETVELLKLIERL